MPGDMWSAFSGRRRGCGIFVTAPLLDLNGPITCQHVAMKRRRVSYLGNVYRSYCEPVIYAGRGVHAVSFSRAITRCPTEMLASSMFASSRSGHAGHSVV